MEIALVAISARYHPYAQWYLRPPRVSLDDGLIEQGTFVNIFAWILQTPPDDRVIYNIRSSKY